MYLLNAHTEVEQARLQQREPEQEDQRTEAERQLAQGKAALKNQMHGRISKGVMVLNSRGRGGAFLAWTLNKKLT